MVVYLVVNHFDIGNMNVKVRILTIFLWKQIHKTLNGCCKLPPQLFVSYKRTN